MKRPIVFTLARCRLLQMLDGAQKSTWPRLRDAFLERVASDRRLKGGTPFKVAYLLCKLVNITIRDERAGTAWPPIDKISEFCGTEQRQVIRAIKNLEDCGYFAIERRRRAGNRYVPILPDDTAPNVTSTSVNERRNDASISDFQGPNNCLPRQPIVTSESVHPSNDFINPSIACENAPARDDALALPSVEIIEHTLARLMRGNILWEKALQRDTELPVRIARHLVAEQPNCRLQDVTRGRVLNVLDVMDRPRKVA